MRTVLFSFLLFLTYGQLSAQKIHFEVLQNTEYEQIAEQSFFLTKEDDLTRLPKSFLEKAKEIDLQKHAAVFIALGERNTGGFEIEVLEVFCRRKKLTVRFREIKPQSGEMLTMAFTYPAKLFLLKNARCKKYLIQKVD